MVGWGLSFKDLNVGKRPFYLPSPLGHNRVIANQWSRKWEIQRLERTHDLSWKNPVREKNHGSTRLQTTLYREVYNDELQGDDLELAVLATGGGNTQRRRPLPLSRSISLSLSRLLSLHSSRVEKQKNE